MRHTGSLERYVLRASRLSREREIFDLLDEICAELEFSGFVYRFYAHGRQNSPDASITTNHSNAFAQFVAETTKTNAVMRRALTRCTPMLWSLEDDLYDDGSNKKKLTSFKVNSGITLPLHLAFGAWGVLTFNSPGDIKRDYAGSAIVSKLALIGIHVFEATQILRQKADFADYPLTGRQRECLKWCSEGKTSWEISRILGISEQTVTFHLKEAMQRLGARNRTQALTVASRTLSNEIICNTPFKTITHAMSLRGCD